jgi:hypothetical protein
MRPWISRHLGTLVVGGVVLVVLMASSATAALVITGKDIKNSSVTTKDIKDGTLRTADLNARTRADLRTAPFVGSPCTIPPPQGGAGKVTMNVDQDGVIVLVCSTPPVSAADDDDDGDGFKKSQECNDVRPLVNPAAVEAMGNRYDDDCDGAADNGTTDSSDADADGHALNAGDCDDTDSTVFPGATDTFGNGVDNNCDGVDGVA